MLPPAVTQPGNTLGAIGWTMEVTPLIAAWGVLSPRGSIHMEPRLAAPSTWPGRSWNGVPTSTISIDMAAVPAAKKHSLRCVVVRGVLAATWHAARRDSATTRADATPALAFAYSLVRY